MRHDFSITILILKNLVKKVIRQIMHFQDKISFFLFIENEALRSKSVKQILYNLQIWRFIGSLNECKFSQISEYEQVVIQN